MVEDIDTEGRVAKLAAEILAARVSAAGGVWPATDGVWPATADGTAVDVIEAFALAEAFEHERARRWNLTVGGPRRNK